MILQLVAGLIALALVVLPLVWLASNAKCDQEEQTKTLDSRLREGQQQWWRQDRSREALRNYYGSTVGDIERIERGEY